MRSWCGEDGMLWVDVQEDLVGGMPMTTLTLEHSWGTRGGRCCVGVSVDGLRGKDEDWKREVIEELVTEMDWQHSRQPGMFTPGSPGFNMPDEYWGPTGEPGSYVNRNPESRANWRRWVKEHPDR
jgi:hypothetical protein